MRTGTENGRPEIAVKTAGVVLVTWADRRDNPDDDGYYIRASASLDGGDSWLPSARISSAPNEFYRNDSVGVAQPMGATGRNGNPFNVTIQHRSGGAGGHTNGLAADRNGVFHAAWVDDRTGIEQTWTAPISVNGNVTKYGDASLEALTDVSSKTQIYIGNAHFDRASGTAWVDLSVKNVSMTPMTQVKLRVLSLGSTFTLPSARNPILSFAGTLAPGSATASRRLQVKIGDMNPEKDDKCAEMNLLTPPRRCLAAPRGYEQPVAGSQLATTTLPLR